VQGKAVVRNKELVSTKVDNMLRTHATISRRIQKLA